MKYICKRILYLLFLEYKFLIIFKKNYCERAIYKCLYANSAIVRFTPSFYNNNVIVEIYQWSLQTPPLLETIFCTIWTKSLQMIGKIWFLEEKTIVPCSLQIKVLSL